LKSEIAAKLDAKGVNSYLLEIVPKDQDGGKGGRYVWRRDEENHVPQNHNPGNSGEGAKQTVRARVPQLRSF
jgi:Protein of unknown function (DUF1161)